MDNENVSLKKNNVKDTNTKISINSIGQILKENNLYDKSAIFISILAVIILLIIFYAITQNMKGLDKKITSLNAIKQESESTAEHVSKLSQKIAALENTVNKQKSTAQTLPYTVRNTLLDQIVSQLKYIASNEKKQAAAEELLKAIELLQKAKQKIPANTPATKPEPIP